MGARRFVVYGVGPIGCTPNQLAGQNCADRVNQMVVLFNSALRSLIIDLNLHLTGANLAYVDVYGILTDVLTNPISYGQLLFIFFPKRILVLQIIKMTLLFCAIIFKTSFHFGFLFLVLCSYSSISRYHVSHIFRNRNEET